MINKVIVIDLGNYKSSFAEEVPFTAEVIDGFDNPPMYIVKSLITNKEYEIYTNQILELLSAEEIKNIVDVSKY